MLIIVIARFQCDECGRRFEVEVPNIQERNASSHCYAMQAAGRGGRELLPTSVEGQKGVLRSMHFSKVGKMKKKKKAKRAKFLMDLSERIFMIPVSQGVDQGDYDELRSLAFELSPEAVREHITGRHDVDSK